MADEAAPHKRRERYKGTQRQRCRTLTLRGVRGGALRRRIALRNIAQQMADFGCEFARRVNAQRQFFQGGPVALGACRHFQHRLFGGLQHLRYAAGH